MLMTVACIAICVIVGYLFGTISTAYIVGKKNNIDIREYGSKNAGATNTMRTLGKKAGTIVFLGDCIKAVAAILVMLLVLQSTGLDPETIKLATGFGAVLGHNFPFWLGFKGGKGIAVTSTVILVFCLPEHWICPAMCLALFILICVTTKYVSLGSLVVVTTFLVYVAMSFTSHSQYMRLLIMTLLLVLLAYYMHRANIVRLLKGTENKLGSKKEKQKDNKVQPQQMNNQEFNNNQMFLEPSDLVDTSDFQDNKFNENVATEQLYNTQFFDVSNVNASNTNSSNVADFDIQKGNNAYYRGYESCDTLDETRQLDDSELLEEANDMLNSTKSYYDK